MSKEIKLTITPDGIKWESEGYNGDGCLEAFGKFTAHMKSIGVETKLKSQELKSEVYASETVGDHQENSL
jgi:hypothetical protein